MSEQTTPLTSALNEGAWKLDPNHSSIEFSVPHFYGLMKVRGRFNSYESELNLEGEPAVSLKVDAASVDTGNAKRDKHLRSDDFFDTANHPAITFTSDTAVLGGDRLEVSGRIEALGNTLPIEIPLTLTPAGDDGFDVRGTVLVDQRKLGITWSPLGITRTPTTISVRGRLVR